MTRIALVKTSSLGDVIHALPVVDDIRRHLPQARIEWVVEEAFAELPALHPHVAAIHRVAMRRWRRQPFSAQVRREFGDFRRAFRERPFDLVLDLQGLMKSAVLARQARGPVAGPDRHGAREPLAAWLYHRRVPVNQRQHAIAALRELAGGALGYRPEGGPSHTLRLPETPLPAAFQATLDAHRPVVVLLAMSARADKLWPLADWQVLRRRLEAQGCTVVLPWGSEEERQRMLAIAEGSLHAVLPPRLSLSQCAVLLAGARLVVGLDTGLTHLAAALERPLVFIVPDSARWPRWRAEPTWLAGAVALGDRGRLPSAEEAWAACAGLLARPAPVAGLSA